MRMMDRYNNDEGTKERGMVTIDMFERQQRPHQMIFLSHAKPSSYLHLSMLDAFLEAGLSLGAISRNFFEFLFLHL
jgi:hypothetical protein